MTITDDQLKLILAVLGAIIGVVGTILGVLSYFYNRKRNRTQAFYSLLQMEQAIKFSKCMDVVRLVGRKYAQQVNKDKTNSIEVYNAFVKTESEETQYCIRTAVDFVNHLEHMNRLRFFDQDAVLQLYNLSMKACHVNLWPWWFDGFRAENGNFPYYANADNVVLEAFNYKWSRKVLPERYLKSLKNDDLLWKHII